MSDDTVKYTIPTTVESFLESLAQQQNKSLIDILQDTLRMGLLFSLDNGNDSFILYTFDETEENTEITFDYLTTLLQKRDIANTTGSNFTFNIPKELDTVIRELAASQNCEPQHMLDILLGGSVEILQRINQGTHKVLLRTPEEPDKHILTLIEVYLDPNIWGGVSGL